MVPEILQCSSKNLKMVSGVGCKVYEIKVFEVYEIHGLYETRSTRCTRCTNKRAKGAGNRPEPKILKTQLGQAFSSSSTKGTELK